MFLYGGQATSQRRFQLARKVIHQLIDDIDGGDADSTITLSYGGATYELDLSDKNKSKLEEALKPYLDVARKTSGRASRSSSGRSSNKAELQKIRDWAEKNGIEVSSRGRIAQSVIDQYNAAN